MNGRPVVACVVIALAMCGFVTNALVTRSEGFSVPRLRSIGTTIKRDVGVALSALARLHRGSKPLKVCHQRGRNFNTITRAGVGNRRTTITGQTNPLFRQHRRHQCLDA